MNINDLFESKKKRKNSNLNEFAPDDGGGSRKFIPWPEFIEQVKQIVGKDFDCVENVVKTTIKARFVPHDPMEYGPTMLYSYYETRAGGRNKGAVSTRGAIQIGKYTGGGFTGQIKGKLLTTFSLLKGHPFERHFDLTFDNIYKIANIILGNTQGALEFKPEDQGVAEMDGDGAGRSGGEFGKEHTGKVMKAKDARSIAKKAWDYAIEPIHQTHDIIAKDRAKNIANIRKKQVNEYLVKAGMPVEDVLTLNLFQDFDPEEGCAARSPEFAASRQWQQVVRKYAPIANMLEKKLLAQKRPLTDAEAEAVEQTWYDGSDAYDDVEIEYLVDIYNQQIDTLEALLAGNLTDEEFLEQGVAEGSETAADIDKKIAFHQQGQAAAQYKGSMNKMHAKKIRELEAKKAALKQGVAEDESQPTKYRATVEYGPTAADAHFVTVTANSTEEAEAKVAAWCKKKGVRNPMITINGADRPMAEGWKDTATLLGAPVVAGALAVGAQHFDDQKPHVQVGGQNAMIVQYDSSRIPNNAMVLKGADGKMYRVWQQSGKGMNKMTLASPAEVKEGIFDRFKKKAPEPEIADPGNYPRGRADVGQWMTDTVEYYKVKYPESLFKLFCPSYKDYLPVRVRVGTSEQVMSQHMGTYKQLRDANPEAKKLARQRYTEYEKYPSGPSDDYTNKVAEGADERKQNALWAQITAHEQAAKKSKDLKQQHHLKMADQLRSQLKTNEGTAEEFNETEQLSELSTELLAKYKKEAGVSAKEADKAGNYEKGNKRFKGINRATTKQFDNDLKKHSDDVVESRLMRMKRAGYDL